jgi:hypothetical protein
MSTPDPSRQGERHGVIVNIAQELQSQAVRLAVSTI